MLVPKANSGLPSLPLQSLLLLCKAKGSLATLSVQHHFHNTLPTPVECSFKLPVQIDWAVSSLRIIKDDGTVLKAVVKDKDVALEQYSDSISSGMSAFMGNTRGDREIELSLGNIAPGTGVRTALELVFPLKCTGNSWIVRLPEWLQPSWEGFSAVTVAQFEALPMARRTEVLGFTMEIEQSTPILSLTSSTHNLDVLYLADRLKANVALGSGLTGNKGDFCVEFHTSEYFQPNLQTQFDSASGEYMGMLSFIPPLQSPDQASSPSDAPGEYILIIDRSGSMYGNRIEMADEAAILFLKSLPPISKFNVVSFGTHNVWMFPESRLCEAEAIVFAVKQISGFRADMGGNDVLNTLRKIYSNQADPAYPRSLYLLTDGGEPNHSEIVKYVEENSKATRVYSFGIATTRDSMDGWLITEIARVAKGISIFIDNPSTIGKSVISVLKQVMVPALANIAVEWPVQQYEQHPANSLLQDCFLGELFTVFVNFGRQPPLPGSVKVKAIKTDNKADIEMNVELTSAYEPGDSIHKLWAKWAIKDLDLQHRQAGNAQILSRIKSLSKQYGVPSEHTSYICVSENEVPIEGRITSVAIQTGSRYAMRSGPMSMSFGGPPMGMSFGGGPMIMSSGLFGAAPMSMGPGSASPFGSPQYAAPMAIPSFSPPQSSQPAIGSMFGHSASPAKFGSGGLFPGSSAGMARGPAPMSAGFGAPMPKSVADGHSMSFGFDSFASHPESSASSPLASSSFLEIITKQLASGLWPLSAYPELGAVRPLALTGDHWATICVLVLLNVKFRARAEECELILRKTMKALETAGVSTERYQAEAKAALGL